MDDLIFSDKAKWSKVNSCLCPAIVSKYKLGGFQLAILFYIISEYDRQIYTNGKCDGVALSYGDVGRKLNVTIDTAKYCLRTLLQEKLIIKKTGDRRGRSKTIFKPNQELLNKLTKGYLQRNTEDKQ